MLMLVGKPALALDPDRAVRQLSHVWYENQLPQSTVLSIAQHADGSIWLATYGGLARYSGAGFETIDRRNEPVLRSSAITALLEDRSGVLWVGTLNGGLYRTRGLKLEEVPLPVAIESVFGLAQDAAGAIWMTTNAGIVRSDASGAHLFGADSGFPRGVYRAVISDATGDIWIAVDGTGVAHWHAGKVDVIGVDRGLPSVAVYTLGFDSAGVLWAGTQSGLARYAGDRFELEPRAAAVVGKRVYATQGDRDGNLWISVLGFGICRLNTLRMDCDRDMPGLGNQVVRSTLEDREGNIWIGTTDGGVHRLSDSKLITVTGTMESNSVRAVYEDANGTIWTGTDGSGLARYKDRVLVPWDGNARLPSPFTRSLAGDSAGNIWVGSIDGLSRIGVDGRVRNFLVADGLPGNIAFAVLGSHDGGVWAGTSRGLVKVDGDKVTPVAGLHDDDVRALYEAADGKLWIGLRSGLRCLHAGSVDRCGTDGLPGVSVFAFHAAADGSIWIGTSQGIMRAHGGVLSRYSESVGLFGDAVFVILDDAAGHFWISTNRGIARYAQSDFDALDAGTVTSIVPTWFGKSDGMLSPQGNGASQSPALRSKDGWLWIGTSRGIVRVDPTKQRRNLLPPPVAIEHTLVDGKEVDLAADSKIGPDADRLEFHYAGMSYVAPEAVRYRYRLDGYDHDWVDAVDRRIAYYTNLPPGDYTFRAIASNNDGVWNDIGASESFSIVPHLWETRWFRFLALFVVLGLLVGMYRLRVWRLHASERSLMREVALRTDALRAANAELRRLASLDGLTRIANRGAFDERLTLCWVDHCRRDAPLAVLLCDIDAFKAYNDTYGHLAGDAALATVAGTLASVARSGADLAARYGGEEFALLLTNCGADEAMVVAQRLLETIRALAIEHRSSSAAAYVTISIGISVLVPDTVRQPDVLVGRADDALYRAKAQGRNRVCGPDPE